MNGPGSLRRACVPILAAVLVAQGVLGLVPHQHHSGAVPGATRAPVSCSSPDRPQIAPAVDGSHPAAFCLACAITPSAFSRSAQAPTLTCDSSFRATAPPALTAACLPRPWRGLDRGPPCVA